MSAPAPLTPSSERLVPFGPGVIVRRHPAWSFRLDARSLVVCVLFLALTFAVFLASLASGTVPIPLREVIDTLLGNGSGGNAMVILEWRAPRALLAALLGAALAISGAIFQSLTRNPLGSPDIIGFASGSYTGALVTMLLVGAGTAQVATGSLIGGIITAFLVFLLAYRGGVQGFRLIIVGIGVSAMLGAFNTWLILRANIEDAMRAGVWGSGSLNGLSVEQLWPVITVLAVLVPLAVIAGPTLRQIELGDDAARALGTRPNVARLFLIVLGVALTALVTAVAGPIAFISLVAPQIARRLTRTAGVAILPSAVLGAFLLVSADFLAQRLFAPVQLPVGILTVCVGGGYFVWLLVLESKRS